VFRGLSMTKYCFICSAARSGSTLLDLMLGAHSTAASLGEFVFLGKALALDQQCSCGAPTTRCPGWAQVFDHIRREAGIDLIASPYALQQWDARASVIIDRNFQTPLYTAATKLRSGWCDARFRQRRERRLPLPESLARGRDNTLLLYRAIAAVWDKRLLIDSSKNVHHALAVQEVAPRQTYIIYLTRDGRGVYHSRRSSGFSERQAALGWYRYNRRAMKLLEANTPPERLARVRYEDLVSDPGAVMRRLSGFLEIDFEPAMLQPNPATQHIVNGNDVRHRRNLTVRPDERWKQALPQHELERFRRLTRTLNEQLGYR
jgi:hypothetical protein